MNKRKYFITDKDSHTCKICGETKPIDMFYCRRGSVGSKRYPHPYCTKCHNNMSNRFYREGLLRPKQKEELAAELTDRDHMSLPEMIENEKSFFSKAADKEWHDNGNPYIWERVETKGKYSVWVDHAYGMLALFRYSQLIYLSEGGHSPWTDGEIVFVDMWINDQTDTDSAHPGFKKYLWS